MSNGPPQAAIIISTYNWPEALGLVLQSALRQSEPNFELIVADDGSRPDTASVVASTLGSSDARWRHVRQDDLGFRLSRVRNLGARHASAPLLIFIDHDTPLHPDFVADHVRLSGTGWFVQGKRCFLPSEYTASLLQGNLNSDWWPRPWLRGLENRKNSIHAPCLGQLLSVPKSFEKAIRGCNLAVRREDFLRVDGFDELYDGAWGREDSDFAYRLFHQGIRCRNAWWAALQAHLHHRQTKHLERNHLDEELDRMQRERRTRAVRGISKMDSEGSIVASSPGFPGR